MKRWLRDRLDPVPKYSPCPVCEGIFGTHLPKCRYWARDASPEERGRLLVLASIQWGEDLTK